jgi:hypothetical protein
MSKVMVRYKVKPERAQENEQLIRAVYEELKSTVPAVTRPLVRRLTASRRSGAKWPHLIQPVTRQPWCESIQLEGDIQVGRVGHHNTGSLDLGS